MTHTEAIQVFREFLFYTIMMAMPALALSLVVGLTISIFQAATSIQEQTLSFVPRLLILAMLFLLTAPWMVQVAVYFTTQMFWKATLIGQ